MIKILKFKFKFGNYRQNNSSAGSTSSEPRECMRHFRNPVQNPIFVPRCHQRMHERWNQIAKKVQTDSAEIDPLGKRRLLDYLWTFVGSASSATARAFEEAAWTYVCEYVWDIVTSHAISRRRAKGRVVDPSGRLSQATSRPTGSRVLTTPASFKARLIRALTSACRAWLQAEIRQERHSP